MSHPAWIGNWTQPPGMVGSNGTAGFSSRRMPCILLLEKPVLVVVWLQCNIGLRHSAFGVGGLAEDTPSAPTEPRTCTWGEGVAYATKATHSPQRRACCKATFLFGTMMRRKQSALQRSFTCKSASLLLCFVAQFTCENQKLNLKNLLVWQDQLLRVPFLLLWFRELLLLFWQLLHSKLKKW